MSSTDNTAKVKAAGDTVRLWKHATVDRSTGQPQDCLNEKNPPLKNRCRNRDQINEKPKQIN